MTDWTTGPDPSPNPPYAPEERRAHPEPEHAVPWCSACGLERCEDQPQPCSWWLALDVVVLQPRTINQPGIFAGDFLSLLQLAESEGFVVSSTEGRVLEIQESGNVIRTPDPHWWYLRQPETGSTGFIKRHRDTYHLLLPAPTSSGDNTPSGNYLTAKGE